MTSQHTQQRINWIDFAKALCMFLVVYGHAGDSYFTNELSWFRIPLFFFLSGILF